MPDVRAFQSVVEAAEQAAAAGDFARAETLLREAAGLQEAQLGSLHPDLASTFNNLAVVCEMAERPAEAEQFYRRAYAIATATLGPGHALVATSRDNLRDFCQARGLPLEEWTEAAAPAEPAEPVEPAEPAEPAAPPAQRPTPVAAPARRSIRRASLWAALILVVLGVAAGLRVWPTPPPAGVTATAVATPTPTAAPAIATAPPASQPPPPEAPSSPGAAAPPAAAATLPAPNTTPEPSPPPAHVATTAPAAVRVVTATVCRTLTTRGAWRCTAAGAEGPPGALTFYTRIASPRELRVRHRWYEGERLRHDVGLRVGANAREGYRTFSRYTVGPGQWRVELRTENGALLDEVRFVAR